MDSEENEIEENMFAIISKHEESETDPDTPPPSPLRNQNKPGFFSLTQVSMKITEFISSAQKKVFGEDYWIPTDSYEVVEFPAELLVAHKVVYPMDLHEKSRPTLKVVQGTFKNAPGQPLHHVVYTSKYEQHRISWTIFRSNDLGEAVDFCRRCEDCRILLKMMDKGKDFRRTIREMTNQFQFHPLWRMVHIAIACRRVDVFTDEGLTTLKENGYSLNEITNTVSTPEGKYPLMIAIETQQPEIVKFLLNHGADPSARDMNGNNALHYAALASVQMIEIVWEDPRSKVLLNSVNDDHVTPVLLCIRNANPRCLATLLGYGAELNLRTTGRNPLFEAMQSRGKTTDVIRQLLAASPNLVHERDQSGNTVLHVAMYKNSLMGLLYLQARHLDLNIRNKAGQTPLHVYTTRDELGMVITMASYGCDLNATNLNGDTALHIAVSHRYLEISRFLLSVGADPNLVNKHGESPRHMAAKLNETQLLKSLIICGAKRCPPVKSGCVSGCVNSKSIQMLSFRVTSESGPSPRSFADLEKIENRKFDSVGHGNFIQQYIQDNIYEEMIEKLQFIADQKSENSDTDYINLLSMDGGGIRGLVIVQILVEIEKLFGESIFKYFDWIAGTSTGALVASGLCQGKSCRDCQMIYLRFKDMVFDGWVRPYSANALETFMQTEVGNTTTMSDIRWPRLMITTVRADVFPVQLEIMRNYQLPLTISENIQLGFDNPDDLQLWRALRRTSAAPTFFPNAENKYIDGGIISNNPLLDLLTEVDLWNSTNQYKGYSQRVKVGCILSIGTGVIPTIPLDPNTLEISANPVNAAVAIKNLGVIIVDQATATEGAPVARALSWCSTLRTPFFRLSSPLFKDISMDTTNDHDLARMMWECVEYVYENQAYIDKMVTLLRKIGPSNRRKHLFQPPNLKYCNMQTQTSAPASPEGPPLFI